MIFVFNRLNFYIDFWIKRAVKKDQKILTTRSTVVGQNGTIKK